jgi:8-amino-3,8-dideoxy-alpha-D-manno-octulosonate transaminase
MIGTWWIGEPERAAAAAVVQSKSLFRHYGPRLRHEADAFEQEVQSVIGVRHALAMSSGTAALRSALRALDLRPGQEVLVPSCTFIATSNAVVLAGGVPVFCEVDEGLGLDPGRLHDRVTSKTAGIIAVHLQGEACRIEDILAFARAHDLWLIEDAAQALGVRYQNRMAGAFGDIGVFSLQAHKTITCGEGGLLVTEDPVLYARARRFHDQGGERIGDGYPDWEHEHAGFGENFKISELQAAVARVQLTRLNAITQRMREVDGAVRSMLPEGVELRKRHDGEGALPCALTFYVREQRERAHALERLAASGIPADAAYSDPIYRTGPYRRWADGESVFAAPHFAPPPTFQPCPDSERLLSRMVRIPLSPLYGPPQLERIAEAIRSLVEEGVT